MILFTGHVRGADWHPPPAGGKDKWVDDPGGRGTEIGQPVRLAVVRPLRARRNVVPRHVPGALGVHRIENAVARLIRPVLVTAH